MICKRNELSDALAILEKIADQKSIAFADVELRPSDGDLFLRATDGSCDLLVVVPLSGDSDLFMGSVNAKKLYLAVKSESSKFEHVELTRAEQSLAVLVDGMTIRIPAREADLFSLTDGDESWVPVETWNTGGLLTALEYVLPAMSKDGTREHISCLSFEPGNLVCTDGHRMHVVPFRTNTDCKFTVPSSSATKLHSVLKKACAREITVIEDDSLVSFTAGRVTFTAKKGDKDFPPYEQVMIKKNPVATLESKQTLKIVRKLLSLGVEGGLAVHLNGSAEFSATSDGEIVSVNAPLLDRTGDEEITFGVDFKYLLDALSKSHSAELSIEAPLDPIRLDLDGVGIALIMPMRI